MPGSRPPRRPPQRRLPPRPEAPAALAARIQRAIALHHTGQLEQAEVLYREVLAQAPAHFDAVHMLGVLESERGRNEAAVELIRQAIAVDPRQAAAHANLGIALRRLGRAQEALASFDRALALDSRHHEAHFSRGNTLLDLKRPDAALASYERALAIRPERFATLSNRGNALRDLKRFEEALASYDRALALEPGHRGTLNNRGNALIELNRPAEALASYDRAVAIDPGYLEALNNRGAALLAMNRHADALASYERVFALAPDHADAHFNQSQCRLLLGNFDAGWRQYEWRWKSMQLKGFRREFAQPLWLGEPDVRGKTVLLHTEQGLGDAIQFCRYAKLVADKGATVLLEVQPRLRSLLASLEGPHRLLARGEPLPAFDLHCPLLSLPLAFGTRLDTIPSSVPYLRVDTARVAAWREKLGEKTRPRVGLAWSGSTAHLHDRNRSIPLAGLVPLLSGPAQYFSLQHRLRPEDEPVAKDCRNLRQFGAEIDDFADMAALIELMDLVVTVDTAVAHLAGALGKPMWIMLAFSADWRWLTDREDSPWYPGARLFRQSAPGDWAGVIERVAGELQQRGQLDQAAAHTNLGMALRRLGRAEEALASCERALALQPASPHALLIRGNALRDLGRQAEALESYERALALRPDYPEALNNRGNALRGLKRHAEALASYECALALKPDFPEALNNRGNALRDLQRPGEALASFDRALALKPDSPEVLNNRGTALRDLGRLEEALLSFQGTLALDPDHADARSNQALCRLLMGDFEGGWRQYEWRWRTRQARETRPGFTQPLWLGEQEVRGKTLLLHAEQGLGDTIQFCRYAKLVADKGATVLLQVQPALTSLLATLDGPSRVLARGEPLPGFDLHCPLLSLPLAFATRLDTIPAAVPYLKADPARLAAWRDKLGEKTRPRVGLAWCGSTAHPNDHKRSIPLSGLVPLLSAPAQFFSLQHRLRPGDEPAVMTCANLRQFGAEIDDFADMAALIEQMDLVVTVDTAMAHLVGALGKPVWIMLAFSADWRWLLEREDSPWYPGARLYRQSALGDWGSVVDRVRRDLVGSIGNGPPPRPGPSDALAAKIRQGFELRQRGQPDAAERLYREVLAQAPGNFDALHMLGVIENDRRRYDAALGWIGRAIAQDSRQASSHANLAVALLGLKRSEEALASCDRALALEPDYYIAHNNRGLVLLELGRSGDALASFEQALRFAPSYAAAHANLGIVLRRLGRLRDAIACQERALALDPGNAPAHANLAVTLLELQRPEDALASTERALALNPDYPEAHSNRGVVLMALLRPAEARAAYQRALALAPDYVDAHFNLSQCLLQSGNFAQGWREYEWRWKGGQLKSFRREFAQPLWLGEQEVRGKTVLLHAEQGLGDTIQFCRYAKLVADKGATVLLEARPALRSLLASLEGPSRVLARGEPLPQFDLHCPLLSLPLACGTRLDAIPAAVPYLRTDPVRVAAWRGKLGEKTRPRVGLAWSGSTTHLHDRTRSIPLSGLVPLLSAPAQFFSLQHRLRPEDEPVAKDCGNLRQFGAEIDDFADVAALIEQMDLVVTVDTAMAHLAGALGRPVWILLQFNPDWRWPLDREDSPWYPSARLFRQPRPGDWASVVERIAGELGVRHVRVALPPAASSASFGSRLRQGAELQQRGQLDQAEPIYRDVLAQAPEYFDALHLLGVLQSERGRDDAALELIRRAIAVNPDQAAAHANLGIVLRRLGRVREALACHDRALALEPGSATARLNASHCRLLLGDFDAGWREYEWRWKDRQLDGHRRDFAQPLWLGEQDIRGRTVLLHAEQGLGDTIQFCRYAKLVADKGATVLLEVQPALKSLLATLDGPGRLLARGEPLPEFDLHCPLMSLPLAFATRLDTIPAAVPYLKADPARVAAWREKLGEKTRPRVGLAWSGSTTHPNDRHRSIPLAGLVPLLSASAQFFSLQHRLRPEDEPAAKDCANLRHFGAEIDDFADMAALIELMDLVISVDTATAHLAGVLGKPVWILLAFNPDWRWLLDRDDSPWYPTARLFRQSAPGDWAGVIERVAGELRGLFR